MGFWKKMGIWNILTGKKIEDKMLGAIVAFDEFEKEQKQCEQNSSEIVCSWMEWSNCHNIIEEDKNKCSNCEKFRTNLKSNKTANTIVNIYDEQGNIININKLKIQRKKFYQAGINIKPGDYFFFSPENKGMFLIGAGEIDGPTDMYDVLDDEDYCVTGMFLRLFDSDSLFIDNGFLISTNLISKVEYINPNGFYSYRIGIDIPEGRYLLNLYDENCPALFTCYDGPKMARIDKENKVETYLDTSVELDMDNGLVLCLDRNIKIDKV